MYDGSGNFIIIGAIFSKEIQYSKGKNPSNHKKGNGWITL